MPDERRVREWAADPDHPISLLYVRAREIGYLRMADEIREIADDGRNDWMERERKSGMVILFDREAVARSELRINTRKWLLTKALPKIYGNRLETELRVNADVAFLDLWHLVASGKAYRRQPLQPSLSTMLRPSMRRRHERPGTNRTMDVRLVVQPR